MCSARARTSARCVCPVFDRGFDPQATAKAGNVAQGVKPGSAAYAAGLRNGMTLLARDGGEPGESDLVYVLRVDDHGVQRTIGYLPRGEGTVMQTRLEITSRPEFEALRRLTLWALA